MEGTEPEAGGRDDSESELTPASRYRPNPRATRTPRGHSYGRADQNIDAIKTLRRIQDEQRGPTADEQEILSYWSGWGGVPDVFDNKNDETRSHRDQLHELLGPDGYAAARAGVVSGFYTAEPIVGAVWDALAGAGATHGHGLEPGCGSGNFIGLAPDGIAMTGVEVDPTTAAIAQTLYPDADIRVEGYEKTPTTRLYDVVVGNVPFSEVRLHDRANNPGNHAIHNHFIIKALSQTKPGGYVALLTTHNTLDARNPAARRDMHERADLLSAIRLPSNTSSPFSDTQVVADLLIFRVRKNGETPTPFTWEHSTPQALPDTNYFRTEEPERIPINDIFYTPNQPAAILGTMTAQRGLYGAWGPTVSPHKMEAGLPAVIQELKEALTSHLARATSNALAYDPDPQQALVPLPPSMDEPVGTIKVTDTGFTRLTQSGWEPMNVPRTQHEQLKALLDLRDRTRALLAAEQATKGDSPELEATRAELLSTYSGYVDAYGPINAVKRTTSQVTDPKTGETITRTRTARSGAVRHFSTDPYAALTQAIEVYDDSSAEASPADLLTSRQLYAAYEPKGADSPADAIAISRAQKGSIDLDYCAYLLGASSPQDARAALGQLVFDTPTGNLIPREEYLSGNVRQKLADARTAAETNPTYQTNVDALVEVMPPDLGVADVVPTVGATWIPAQDHAQFLTEQLSTHATVTYNPVDGWKVRGADQGAAATQIYGSRDTPAGSIFQDMLNSEPIMVDTLDDDGKVVIDPKATEIAKGHADRLAADFAAWVFTDPERTKRLLVDYNERFNSLVPRSYEKAGDALTLPGLSSQFTLHPHQRAAIARMIAEPTTGLFHEVGAGKTLEMVCGVMEQKRLGLVNKPLVVVPNHMLTQFQREWLQAYPSAHILVAGTEHLNKANRAQFMAQATTGRWDAIICTQSAFKKLAVRPETESAFERRQLEQLERWIETSTDQLSVRGAEIRLQRLQSQLQRDADNRQARTDDGITFEDLGIDYLVVDEAHGYKNLSAPTHTVGIIHSGRTEKCLDLEMKLDHLRRTHGDRVATFATATPIANTLGEMWVMTKYLRPDLLETTGTLNFDDWAKTFTAMDSRVEVNAAGAMRVKQRISRFQNLPELKTMWSTFADVKRRDELGLKLPTIAPDPTGANRPRVIVTDIGPAMGEFNASLIKRSDRIERHRISPKQDNFLAITNDARALATDHRLLTGTSHDRVMSTIESPIVSQKVDAVAHRVAAIYHDTKDITYTAADGSPSPVPGALQLVFSDLGTPKKNQWDLYNELKTQLIDSGVPANKIAFIHDAANTQAKDQIFRQAREGAINVLIGSTEKMGTGANMQARAIALHHITCPWRPCDLTQREGRIIRQGNQNPEIKIYRYVTRASFDTFLWQGLERKATFIDQIMNNQPVTDRSIDIVDLSDTEADYATVKAIASGNPLEMEETRLTNEVSRYQQRANQFDREQTYLSKAGPMLDAQHATLIARAQRFETLAARHQTGDTFTMTINGRTLTTRTDAAQHLQQALQRDFEWADRHPNTSAVTYWPIRARISVNGTDLTIGMLPHATPPEGSTSTDQPQQWIVSAADLANDPAYHGHDGAILTTDIIINKGVGAIRRIENHLKSLSKTADRIRQAAAANRTERAQVTSHLGEPNPWTPKLQEAKTQLSSIRAQIREQERGQLTLDTSNSQAIFHLALSPTPPNTPSPARTSTSQPPENHARTTSQNHQSTQHTHR